MAESFSDQSGDVFSCVTQITGKEPIQAQSHSHSSALGNIIRAGGDSCKEVTSEARFNISEKEEEADEMPLRKTKGSPFEAMIKTIEDVLLGGRVSPSDMELLISTRKALKELLSYKALKKGNQ